MFPEVSVRSQMIINEASKLMRGMIWRLDWAHTGLQVSSCINGINGKTSLDTDFVIIARKGEAPTYKLTRFNHHTENST